MNVENKNSMDKIKNKLNLVLTIAIAVVLVILIILLSLIFKINKNKKNEEEAVNAVTETQVVAEETSIEEDTDDVSDYSDWVMPVLTKTALLGMSHYFSYNYEEGLKGYYTTDEIKNLMGETGYLDLYGEMNCGTCDKIVFEKYSTDGECILRSDVGDEYFDNFFDYYGEKILLVGGLEDYKAFVSETFGDEINVDSLPKDPNTMYADSGLYYNEEKNELVDIFLDEECLCGSEWKLDDAVYDTENNEILVYISKITEGEYMYSDVWHIVPSNGTYGFALKGLQRMYMNAACDEEIFQGYYYAANLWSAFCTDIDSIRYSNGNIEGYPYFGVKAKCPDGSEIMAQDILYILEMEEGDNYSLRMDTKYLDFDNDGEIEALFGANTISGYGGICFDFREDGIHVLQMGDGTAMYLSYTWYNNAFWLVYSDITHAGRTTYDLTRFAGDGRIEDQIGLYAMATDEKYENYEYTFRGKPITEEEFETYGKEIFQKGRISIEDPLLANATENVGTADESYKAAYRQKVEEYNAANAENINEWSKLSYQLIYFDDDEIPELVCGLDGYYVSLFTYRNGSVETIMDDWAYGAGGNAGYDYYPRQGIISNVNSDFAGLIRYFYYSTYNPATGSFDGEELGLMESYIVDINGDGIVDWKDANDGDTVLEEPLLYVGDTQISAEEFDRYVSDFVHGETSSYMCENGMSYDQILDKLN